MSIRIQTPPGAAYRSPHCACSMQWDPSLGAEYTERLTRAQKFIDNEVLRFCSARVPLRTGMLQKSGITGTVVGSGLVMYTAPYARMQYYRTAESRIYDPHRGAYWFERGKASERQRILAGAAKIAGGRV